MTKNTNYRVGLHLLGSFAAAALIVFFAALAAFAQIPTTAVVPGHLPEAVRTRLMADRVPIESTREQLRTRANEHNVKCKPAPNDAGSKALCKASQTKFNEDVKDFISSINDFNLEVGGNLIIVGVPKLAKKLGWSAKEIERLESAIHGLNIDGNAIKSDEDIDQVWKDMVERGDALAAEAEKGEGPGMPGAGLQTGFEDCAVFALANASGQPYSVVAARATKLMRESDWRDPKDRADPQSAIERNGLKGGEIIMMVEALGRVEVIQSKDFVKTLHGGRPVMVSVWPRDGSGSHEVVLTRTFEHDGQTWFELRDSNQGPMRRLYVSNRDLMMILQENGLAYSPEPETTPKLLR